MTDIVEFLTARLDEQAATLVEYVEKRHKAKMRDSFSHAFMVTNSVSAMLPSPDPLQSLNSYQWDAAIYLDADIAAKRLILRLHQPEQLEYIDGDGEGRMSTDCQTCETGGTSDTWPCDTLKLLTMPYAYHYDHKQAWRVNET